MDLTKGQKIDLKKADGTPVSKIRVGLSWDVSDGAAMDLDLFVIHKETKKVAYFNEKEALVWIKLGEDNLTWEGDGDDETVEMDATKSPDGEYFICVNIFDAVSKAQKFSMVNNAECKVYNSETNEVLATYKITENGGDHTALIVGVVKDAGDTYNFEAKGDFVDGDIEQVTASI